jgi:hypothetical protein
MLIAQECVFGLIYSRKCPINVCQNVSRYGDMGNLRLLSHDSSVGIALSYGLDDRGSRVRFSAGAWNFSLHHRVQNSPGAHPAPYPMGTDGSFPGGRVAGA